MKKLSVFVEGQTEQIFIEKLITEIANRGDVSVKLMKALYGRNGPRKILVLKDAQPEKRYYIQIIDSGSDSSVMSDLREYAASMQQQGFHKLLGLRDVYPHSHKELSRLRDLTGKLIPVNLEIPVKMLFSIMEMETWFLKEHSHLLKIDSRLTLDYIKSRSGYDLADDDLENDIKYYHAAGVLKTIYQLAGKLYSKKKRKVQAIVDLLDYEILYLETIKSLKSFHELIRELDDFFG